MRTKRVRLLFAGGVAAVGIAAIVASAIATSGGSIRGHLTSYQEVPSVSSTADGTFRARRNTDGGVDYTLTYSALEGNVTQSHIHFGQRGVNGGIVVWLCSNLASPPTPAGVQACPAGPATVTGTFDADDVIPNAGAVAQGIAPGELDELLRAIRRGVAYANVHSDTFPGGEIRARLRPHGGG